MVDGSIRGCLILKLMTWWRLEDDNAGWPFFETLATSNDEKVDCDHLCSVHVMLQSYGQNFSLLIFSLKVQNKPFFIYNIKFYILITCFYFFCQNSDLGVKVIGSGGFFSLNGQARTFSNKFFSIKKSYRKLFSNWKTNR